MDYKKELLLFLYENNSGLVEIHPVSENAAVTNGELKLTITALKKDGLIDTDELFRRIGSGDPSRLETAKSLHIKARITPEGENYVRDTYMKKNEINTFNIDQFVQVNGNNNAPISQTKGHSSSGIRVETNSPIKHPPKTLMQTLLQHKTMVTIISTVIGGLILYFITEYLKHN